MRTVAAVFSFVLCGLAWSQGPTLKERLLRDARVWLDEGTKFGRGGGRMQRLNLACPRSVLAEALRRMGSVFGGK